MSGKKHGDALDAICRACKREQQFEAKLKRLRKREHKLIARYEKAGEKAQKAAAKLARNMAKIIEIKAKEARL